MSEDWQAGDLALCVKQGSWITRYSSGRTAQSRGPRAGAILTVRTVASGVNCQFALKFSDYPDPLVPGSRGYNAGRFRRIPPHLPDAEDVETIRLLTGVPIVEPVQ